MQELIDAEATSVIGAGRYERSEARVTERNGSRPRLLTTRAGDVKLSIPKLRAGSFFLSILSPRRRIDQALYAVVMEAYVHGVSTRSVDDLVTALGGTGISRVRYHASAPASTRPSGVPDPPPGPCRVPVHLLGRDLPTCAPGMAWSCPRPSSWPPASPARAGRRSWAWMSATARDEVFWRGFLTSLKKRGLTGSSSSSPTSTPASWRRFPALQGSSHQRCRVHFIRNVLAHVAKAETEMVAAVFRTIFAQPDLGSMSKQWDKVAVELSGRYPKIGTLMDEAKAEVLAFAAFPARALAQDLVHKSAIG